MRLPTQAIHRTGGSVDLGDTGAQAGAPICGCGHRLCAKIIPGGTACADKLWVNERKPEEAHLLTGSCASSLSKRIASGKSETARAKITAVITRPTTKGASITEDVRKPRSSAGQ